MSKGKFKLLSDEEVRNALIGALEGGSNYWFFLKKEATDKIKEEYNNLSDSYKDNVEFDNCISVMLFHVLMNDIEIPVYGQEIDELLGVISLKTMQMAEELMMKEHNESLRRMITGDSDAFDDDIFFQLSVMQDVVFT